MRAFYHGRAKSRESVVDKLSRTRATGMKYKVVERIDSRPTSAGDFTMARER